MTTAIFPVRANPPHIGHIIAFLKIKKKYDKVIVTVSDNTYGELKPSIISSIEVKEILDEVFKHIGGYEIILVNEPFITRTIFDDLPSFDIVVTGNKAVYDNMKKHNIKVELLERTPIYRGKFMRDAYRKGVEYEKSHTNNNGRC